MDFLGDWKVSSGWLEAILVSNIVDGVGDTIGANIGEGSTDSNAFQFGSNIPQLSLFLLGNSVAGLVTVRPSKITLRTLTYLSNSLNKKIH